MKVCREGDRERNEGKVKRNVFVQLRTVGMDDGVGGGGGGAGIEDELLFRAE